jgi:hypothetical protein
MIMHTVADFATTGTLTFTQALAQAERLATEALPAALHGRLTCAVSLVKEGHCFQAEGGTWTVDSASTHGKTYTPNGTCVCHDVHYNQPPRGLCKHRLAVYLSRKVQALLTVAQTPPASAVRTFCADFPQPEVVSSGYNLPEAPASVNVRVQIGGREVQWTLRDTDEKRLATRLEALLQRYPVAQPTPQASSPKMVQEIGYCAKHHVEMTLNTKENRQWWSHYDETAGRWCKGK